MLGIYLVIVPVQITVAKTSPCSVTLLKDYKSGPANRKEKMVTRPIVADFRRCSFGHIPGLAGAEPIRQVQAAGRPGQDHGVTRGKR